MEQNTITNEELHGIITDLVHKVESLECCILTLVDPQSGDKLMDTKELCEYMHKCGIYTLLNGTWHIVEKSEQQILLQGYGPNKVLITLDRVL